MSDKKMNDFPTAADGAFVYAEDANGNQIKISKADLASVVAELLSPVMSKLDETGNLNNLVINGIYTAVNTSDIDKVSTLNYPTNNKYWLVIVFLAQQITFQIAVNIETNDIYSRISNDLGKNWKVWKSL